jgi:hypothetical protein
MHKQSSTIANYIGRVDHTVPNTFGITINRGSAEGQRHKNGIYSSSQLRKQGCGSGKDP